MKHSRVSWLLQPGTANADGRNTPNPAADHRDASQTLALVLKRSQPPQIGAVLAAYQKNTAAQARLSLMEVMGQTSSEQALPVLRDALKDPTAEIRRGAILAMTDWPTPPPCRT